MSAPPTGFRPASGWQQGEPSSAPPPTATGARRPVATAMLVAASYLVAVQGLVAVASSSDATPVALLDAGFTWLAGGATLAVLFAAASRSSTLLAATGLVAALDAIAYGVLGATGLLGVFDPPAVAIALVLSAAGAAIGVVAAARPGRTPLSTTSLVLAAAGVLAFYAISIVAPIVALGVTDQTIATAARTFAIPVVAIVAGVLLALPGRAPSIAAGIALVVFACTLAASPVVSTVAGTPPVAGALVVIVLRFAVVVAAAIVVLRTSSSR